MDRLPGDIVQGIFSGGTGQSRVEDKRNEKE